MSLTIPCIANGYDCADCHQLKYFYDLICTPHDINQINEVQCEQILHIMNEYNFINIINEIYKNNHSCISFSFTNMRLDVIDFLRQNNKIVIDKRFNNDSNIFNGLEILYTLFNEFYNNFTATQKAIKHIEYFWNWCEEENPIALIEFRNYFTSKTMCHAILNCMNNKIKKQYYQKYMNLWYKYCYGKDFPYISAPTETTDGETIIFLLIHSFMADELKSLLTHETFKSSSYEWRVFEIRNKEYFSVPIICHILDQFSWARDKKTLKKIANILNTLIQYGNFNYDDVVVETGHTIMDYLSQFGYIYNGSPVMEVFKNIKLKPTTGILIKNVYKYDETIPYDMIWQKYEFTKDPEMAEEIFDEIIQEYDRTGVDYDNFLEKSNLHIIINRLSNVPSVVFDDNYIVANNIAVIFEQHSQAVMDVDYMQTSFGENPYGFINENNELICNPMIVSDNHFNQVVVM